MLSDGCGGIGGGSGSPSATRRFVSENFGFGGIGGGNGSPSATRVVLPHVYNTLSVTSIPLVEALTGETAGSRMNRVKAQIARTNAVFFKGVTLLSRMLGGYVRSEISNWKMFCLRNAK